MGLFDIVEGAAKGFVLSGGNPFGAFVGGIQGKQEAQAEKFQKQFAAAQETNRSGTMAINNDFGFGYADPYASQLKPNVQLNGGGNGNFFTTLRGGIQEVGGLVKDVFSTGIPQFFGVGNGGVAAGKSAVPTTINIGAQETGTSGTIDANMLNLLPSLIGAGRNLLKSPGGQLALGGGAGLAASFMSSDGKKMRVTRKMKSQARMIVNLTGGNLSAAADILGINQNTLVAILLKRFRNDGAVVTKAALRKTRQTVRRMKSMCDMYDDLKPRTTTRRRAPMRRSTTTLIKN